MKKQSHFFDELSISFSRERLDAYLSHNDCNNNKNDALVTYSWNIELSAALYPSLQILEITLRNSLHNTFAQHFKTEQWFELPCFYKKEQARIKKAINTLKEKNKETSAGRIVAELSFGFWVSLFDIRYEHKQILWPKLIKPCFPYLPKYQRTRHFLLRELSRIRILRNRIFHYEPIWHWKDLIEQHDSIIHLAKSMSPFTVQYLQLFDRFKEVHNYGKNEIKRGIDSYLIDEAIKTNKQLIV